MRVALVENFLITGRAYNYTESCSSVVKVVNLGDYQTMTNILDIGAVYLFACLSNQNIAGTLNTKFFCDTWVKL